MAAKRIELIDIRQLLRLRLGGHSNRRIAALTGLYRNSVNSYVSQLEACNRPLETLLELSDADLGLLFVSNSTIEKDRYEALSDCFEYFRKELKSRVAPGKACGHGTSKALLMAIAIHNFVNT